MSSQVNIANRLVRFMENLPSGGDSTLVVLKGHLLIEELISEILKIKLKGNPLKMKVSERWMFAKKLEFFWAICPDALPNDLWPLFKELNDIRNKMSHSVKPEGIDDKLQKFVSNVEMHPKNKMPKNDDVFSLEYAIGYLYSLLNTILNELKNSYKAILRNS
jgi:hypothetical protein